MSSEWPRDQGVPERGRGGAREPMSPRPPILMYHSISTQASKGFRRFAVDPALFATHMHYLAETGHRTRTMDALVAGSGTNESSSDTAAPRTVALTFDDGYADFHTEVLPLLEAFGFTATLYVTSGYIGGTSAWMTRQGEGDRPMLSWTQLAEIADSGIEIAAHTITHPELDVLPPHRVWEEVVAPKHLLEDRLQVPVRSFAYPFGYYDGRVRAAVGQAGYTSACAVNDLSATTTDDVLLLPRLTVPRGTDTASLHQLLERESGAFSRVLVSVKQRTWRAWRRRPRRVQADDIPGPAWPHPRTRSLPPGKVDS